MENIDYLADTYSDDQQEDHEEYSNEDGAITINENYYSSEDDRETAKKTNHSKDGEATTKNEEDYYSSEDDGEAAKKADNSREKKASIDTKETREGDKEREEETYDDVFEYLTKGSYPEDATKRDKGVLRRKAKSFQVVDGILQYKGKNGELRQVLRITIYCKCSTCHNNLCNNTRW